MQHAKAHTVPVPALPHLAARAGPSLQQQVASLQRTPYIRMRLHRQHTGRAAYMVGVAVAEHQAVQARDAGLQHRHQYTLAGVAVQAVARTGVIEQDMLMGAHQDGIALADVSGHQLKLARWRRRRAPHAQRQQQGQAHATQCPGQG